MEALKLFSSKSFHRESELDGEKSDHGFGNFCDRWCLFDLEKYISLIYVQIFIPKIPSLFDKNVARIRFSPLRNIRYAKLSFGSLFGILLRHFSAVIRVQGIFT